MSCLSVSKRRILVVDDEPGVCHLVRVILTGAGYEVKTAWSAKEALTILESELYNLVITDFTMSGMKGDELSAVIKERWPKTAVVMLTACAANLRAADRLTLPFIDALIDKPFELDQFRRVIADVLSRSNGDIVPSTADSATTVLESV